jgi:hypothetical protein
MFRLILNSVISLLLLITTTGYTIFEHYCGDRLVSVSVNAETEQCCDMKGGCCNTESKHYQLDNKFIPTTFHLNTGENIITDTDLFNNTFILQEDPEALSHNNILAAESPPPLNTSTLLSQFQSYIL